MRLCAWESEGSVWHLFLLPTHLPSFGKMTRPGSTFIVCQRGLSLLPNKACVLSALGDHFNLCRNMKFWCQNEGFFLQCSCFNLFHGQRLR
uniref:Uncharacterized protein n=1 Tax=Sus scrofa TaxID=9823 RepID=A0A4X1UJX7_PIG